MKNTKMMKPSFVESFVVAHSTYAGFQRLNSRRLRNFLSKNTFWVNSVKQLVRHCCGDGGGGLVVRIPCVRFLSLSFSRECASDFLFSSWVRSARILVTGTAAAVTHRIMMTTSKSTNQSTILFSSFHQIK